MSATRTPIEPTGCEDVGDVELVGSFYALALQETTDEIGVPWGVRSPNSRLGMRKAFREICDPWLPDGILDDAAEWMDTVNSTDGAS